MRIAFCLVVAAACAGTAFGFEDSAPVREPHQLTSAVEFYLAHARAVTSTANRERLRPLSEQRLLSAPAAGGVLGWFQARADFWYPGLDGTISSQGAGLVDVGSDLGLGGEESGSVPRIRLSLGGIGIRFDGFFLKYSGTNVLTRTITFAGTTFQVSDSVRSHLKINNVRLLVEIPLVRAGFLSVSAQGGISYFDLDGRVESTTLGAAGQSGSLPVPVAGILAQARFGRFLAEIDITGLTIDLGGIQGTTFDVQASFGSTFFKVVAVRVGYRAIVVDGSGNGLDVDVTLDGFFAGVSVQF